MYTIKSAKVHTLLAHHLQLWSIVYVSKSNCAAVPEILDNFLILHAKEEEEEDFA